MKLKTTITGRNESTETKLIITTKNLRPSLIRCEQKDIHQRRLDAAHELLMRAYHATEIKIT